MSDTLSVAPGATGHRVRLPQWHRKGGITMSDTLPGATGATGHRVRLPIKQTPLACGGCHFCPSGTFLAGSICVDPGIGPSSSSSSSSSGGGGNGGGNGGGDGGNGGGNGGGDGGGDSKIKKRPV